MLKKMKYSVIILSLLMSVVFLPSCKDFFNPDQELNVTKDKMFTDWYEYRSTAMGLYALQQKLVEQIVVLGELRGDLLTVTPNADADLVEINNFKVSKTNKYADPTNFYKLIAACNSMISVLKTKHPEVLDQTRKVSDLGNYDKLYGEVLCMRAWAYFNAVRIYGKVPVIWESLTSVEEIEAYLNSSSTYIDKVNVVFAQDGFHNDTTYNKPITLTKQFYDVDMVTKVFCKQLEEEVRVVGVNHYTVNLDKTWEVAIWNTYAYHALLGQMYLTSGDLSKARTHLEFITNCYDPDIEYRYQLDKTFQNSSWENIFNGIDRSEHIFTISFNKANQQQNDFQNLFEPISAHKYMLKPTKTAIDKWETTWRGYSLVEPDRTKPWLTTLSKYSRGTPGDYRGYGASFLYAKNGSVALSGSQYNLMLQFKMDRDVRSYTSLMDGVDTMVYKYSINKLTYDEDANFIVYRAGGIQLYLAEVYTWYAYNWTPNDPNGTIKTNKSIALNIVNDGSNYDVLVTRRQLGIRGRVGLTGNGLISASLPIYIHDPYTNEVTGYINSISTYDLQLYIEENILDERARELAFEGERFYDLIRVANRRNDPSFLANKVSAKFPVAQRAAMKALLMNKENWYIHMFD